MNALTWSTSKLPLVEQLEMGYDAFGEKEMRRPKILIIVFGTFCLLLFLATAFLNFFYLPKKAKAFAVKALAEETGLQTELQRLSFHLVKGVTLEGLKLRDPREKTILFQARRVYVQHFWLPLLLKKEFIPSSVTFVKPSFSLTRFPDGRWNLEQFLQKTGQKGKSFALIPRISVVEGTFLFTDQTFPTPFSERINLLNGKVYVGLPAHLYVKGSVGIEGSPLSIAFTGSRPLNKEAWFIRCEATHFSLRDVSPYAKHYLPFLESAEGDLSFEVRSDKKIFKVEKILFGGKAKFVSRGIQGEARLRLTGHVSSREDKEEIHYALKNVVSHGTFQMPFLASPLKEASGELLLQNDTLFFNDFHAALGKTAVSVKGTVTPLKDPELDLTLTTTSDMKDVVENLPQKKILPPLSLEGPVEVVTKVKGKINAPSVSGSLEAKDLSVKGIPSLGTIEHLRGSIAFTENALETGTLTGIHEGFPFELKGTLSDFQNPFVDATLRLMQPLKRLEKAAFFQTLPQNFRPSLEGMGRWDLRVKGPLHQLSQKDLSGSCHILNASLKTALLPSPIEKMDGEFSFDADAVHFKGVTGVHASNSFRLDGSLRQGQDPEVQFTLVTKTFQISSQFTVQGEDLRPFSVSRRTSNTTLSAEGEILNYKRPMLKLSGLWEGPVEELAAFRGKGGDPFLKELQGTVATQFSLAGPKERPEEMAVSGNFSSPLLAYKSLQFKNVSSQYAYRQNALSLSRFSGTLWGGHLLSDATVRLSGENPYTLKMELKQAKLSDVIRHFVPDQKKLKGLLFVTVQAEGELKQPQDVKGEGWFKVEQGDLFEIPMLAGLSPVLRPVIATLYPQLDETFSFHEAYAHCAIGNRTVMTENLILKGDRATLYGQGSVGFDRSVDFRIGVQFTDPQILARPTNLSRLKNILVSDTGMLAGEVQVSGTLKDPKYRYRPLSAEKIPDLFRKTGSALIKRLFE